MRLILLIIERIDDVRSFVISVTSAAIGSGIGIISHDNLALIKQGDPTWFCIIAPYMQVAAWTIAILVGINAIRKKNKR